MRLRQECMSFHDNENEIFHYNDFQNIMEQLMYIRKDEFCNIVNKIHDIPCFISNETGNIIYVNKHWENLCQYNSHEVLGKDFSFLQGKQTNIDTCRKFKKDLFELGYSSMENINYNKKNEPIKLLIKANKINYYDNAIIMYDNYPYFFTALEKM